MVMFKIDKETQTMSIIRKDTALFTIKLDNYDLVAGDSVTFTVAGKVEQEAPAISKTVSDFKDGGATFTLSSSDTNIEVGSYYYDIQVNLQDGRVDTIIGPAKFKVIGGVTY